MTKCAIDVLRMEARNNPLVGDTWQRGLTERHVTEVSESTVTCEVWDMKTGLRRGVAVVDRDQFARWAATATLIRKGGRE